MLSDNASAARDALTDALRAFGVETVLAPDAPDCESVMVLLGSIYAQMAAYAQMAVSGIEDYDGVVAARAAFAEGWSQFYAAVNADTDHHVSPAMQMNMMSMLYDSETQVVHDLAHQLDGEFGAPYAVAAMHAKDAAATLCYLATWRPGEDNPDTREGAATAVQQRLASALGEFMTEFYGLGEPS